MPEPTPESAAPLRGDTISRNAVYAFAAQMGTAAFTAVLTIFLTRKLGPAGFGTFALALSVTGLLLRPAGGGTSQAAARFIAEHHGDVPRIRAVLGMALRYRVPTATGIGILLFALAGPIASLYNTPELVGPLRGAACAFIGQNLMLFLRDALIALRRASEGFRLVISESAAETTATVGLVLAGGGATGAAYGRAAGYAFGVVLGVFILARLIGGSPIFGTGPSPVPRKQFVSYAGAILVVASATAVFSALDILLLGAFLTTSAVGIYSAPLRFIAFLGYPGLAISQGVGPRLAKHPEDPPNVRALERALRYVILFQAWLTALLLVWAAPIVDLLLGSAYAESAGVMRALTPYIFLNGIGPLLFSALNYAGEGRRRIPYAVATVLVAAAVDVVLIPQIGVLGAAVGSDIAYALFIGGHVWLAHRFIGLRLEVLVATSLRSLAAAAVTAGILVLFGTQDLSVLQWIVGLAAGTAAFVAGLLVSREISWPELRTLAREPLTALRRG